MFVVTVTFAVKPGRMDAFLPKIMENARLSLRLEPGCGVFDVCTSPKAPDEVFLYERYEDEAAFEIHKTMPHYLDFSADAEPLLADRTVKTYLLEHRDRD